MNNKSLFQACTTQCEFCADQWPLVNGVHVAPFTKDPNLFSWKCSAVQIRKGFDYWDYKGGKQKKWKVPSAKSLLETYTAANKKAKIGRNLDSPANRSFWRCGIRASLEVNSWPEWKRSIGSKAKTPEEIAKDNADDRQELLFFDAMDYWTRQACTDNHQYRPHYSEGSHGYIVTPTCNHGLGCTTCWAKYKAYYDKESKNWIDI